MQAAGLISRPSVHSKKDSYSDDENSDSDSSDVEMDSGSDPPTSDTHGRLGSDWSDLSTAASDRSTASTSAKLMRGIKRTAPVDDDDENAESDGGGHGGGLHRGTHVTKRMTEMHSDGFPKRS